MNQFFEGQGEKVTFKMLILLLSKSSRFLASLKAVTLVEEPAGCARSPWASSPVPPARASPCAENLGGEPGGESRGKLAGPLPSAGAWGRLAFPGSRGVLGARTGVVASPSPFRPGALLRSVEFGIDRKLQGQLNALRFRALVRLERLQTASQTLRGLRRGDLWRPLT